MVFSPLYIMTTQRATCWSVTINNPTKSDDECVASAHQKSGWKVYGQREKGSEGTEHYQLMVITPQVRFSAVKKAFPRAHIEVARDRTALSKYVQKEDTRIGDIPSDEKYPNLQKLWDMFTDYVMTFRGLHNDWNEDHWLRHFKLFIKQSIDEGYVVETMAVNPQVLSIVKNYGENIINRSLRRQTDRQTSENIVDLDSINASEEESVISSSSSLSSSSDEEGRQESD